ncbi:MAG TPA: class I mannose-6-phosphate isomerase [Planctomycetes bacterium]|nr:class I mannose-6-phosphate isomerase [Planctomycetota bacterium]
MKPYPLKFRPIFKQRIWGGQKLREFGKDIPAEEKIGESWELADLPNDKSEIANGQLAGQTLSSAIKNYPKKITGDENFSRPFPLLIKLLDAQDILSVQVHPDEQTCRRLGKGEPKTECWYIIAAEPGAVIYKGLKKGVSKDKFAEAIKKGSVAELLTEIAVEAGQCYFLPAGTAHSIGAGLLIAEIQTPSDTTYRVFDWNRVDEAGKARQLHIEEALESIHFDAGDDEPTVTTMGRLVDCEYFKIEKGHETKGCELLLFAGEMKILIILTGRGKSTGTNSSRVEFRAGDCLLVPAAYEGAIQFDADTEYLTVSI